MSISLLFPTHLIEHSLLHCNWLTSLTIHHHFVLKIEKETSRQAQDSFLNAFDAIEKNKTKRNHPFTWNPPTASFVFVLCHVHLMPIVVIWSSVTSTVNCLHPQHYNTDAFVPPLISWTGNMVSMNTALTMWCDVNTALQCDVKISNSSQLTTIHISWRCALCCQCTIQDKSSRRDSLLYNAQ